jgi:hypothetical protein
MMKIKCSGCGEKLPVYMFLWTLTDKTGEEVKDLCRRCIDYKYEVEGVKS